MPVTIYRVDLDTERLIPINGGAFVDIAGPPDPDPDPTPDPPASWQDMVDSQDFAVVDAWYETYTGYDGINPNDEDDLPLAYEDLTPVGGAILSSADGQVIEGMRGTSIRIRHNNVTVRRCLIEGGNLYGFYTNPTSGSSWTGTVVEFCTFFGGDPAVDKAAIHNSYRSSIAHTFRNCEIEGWSSGVLCLGGGNFEYCWTHNFYGSSVSGAHVSSFNARANYIRFFRCYGTEGGSPIMSIYFDQNPCNNITIQENILNGSGNNSPSYLLFFKVGEFSASAFNIVMGGNYLGDQYQYGLTAQLGIIAWGTNGNVRTSNYEFLTGDPLD